MISCILSFTIAMLVILCLFYRWKKRKIKEGQTRQKAIIEHLTKENENYEVSSSKLDKETEQIRQKAKATKMWISWLNSCFRTNRDYRVVIEMDL